MRKDLSEVAGVDARLMTYEQLLVLLVYECGEYAIEEYLKTRYEFPALHDDSRNESEDKRE